MLWVSLRAGWGNMAFVAALGLLPLVSLAQPAGRHHEARDHARIAMAAADVDTNRDATPVPRAPVAERDVN